MLFVNKLYIITWGGQVDLENVYILVRLADGVISGESVMYQCRRNGVLVILLTVLIEDNLPYVLFMDEPEVSLHIEWQKRLIDLILDLNPNVQIILTTHSPAVIMNGWMDNVTEVSDITDQNLR